MGAFDCQKCERARTHTPLLFGLAGQYKGRRNGSGKMFMLITRDFIDTGDALGEAEEGEDAGFISSSTSSSRLGVTCFFPLSLDDEVDRDLATF